MIGFSLGWLTARTGTRVELLAELVSALGAPRGCRGRLVGFVNPHVYTLGERDATVRRFLDDCDLLCVDGVGVVLAHRLRGRGALPRTVAEHLFRALLTEVERPARMLLVGIESDAVARAAARMNAESAGPEVVAALDGYADDATLEAFLARHAGRSGERLVDRRGARATERHDIDVVAIGAGSPRSETIALRTRVLLPDAIVFHAGAGTLKTWAGTKRRGPAWMSACGLEWLHRVVFEPHTRRRYVGGGPRFAHALLRHAIGAVAPRTTRGSHR